MTAPDRSEYAAGLRLLADLVEQNPELPLPFHGQSPGSPETVYVHPGVPFAAYVAALSSPVETVDASRDRYGYELTGRLAGLYLAIHADVDHACAATELGQKVVTEVSWRTPLGADVPGTLRPAGGGL